MKVRELKKILNTEYIVQNCGSYLAIGSEYVHNIIEINKETLYVKYWESLADAIKEKYKPLIDELINNGKMREIIDGNDEIKNNKNIFMYVGEDVVETYTDEFGYPNTDYQGFIQFSNTTFENKEDCYKYAIHDLSLGAEILEKRKKELLLDIQNIKKRIKYYKDKMESYTGEINGKV